MRQNRLIGAALCVGALMFGSNHASADEFSARLNGFEELGALNNQTGAILSDGSGTAKLTLNRKGDAISYTLTYSKVGTTPPLTGTVTQAHIHFGKSRDAGGILVFFCSNLGNGPAGTPACPANGGTVKGTWTGANVLAIPGQNVEAGDFKALVDALDSDTAYANIHTTMLTAGEIRGQCRNDDRKDRDDREHR
jgi:hypothetical protein